MKGQDRSMRKKTQQNKTATDSLRVPDEFVEISTDLKKAGWGKDKLTQEIEGAFCNIGVSFLNLKPYFELLKKSHSIFSDACELMSWSTLDGFIACSLFARTAACFLGAVRLSCSGQLTETWVLLRACIENSLYAFYIFNNPERAEIWLNRQNDKECKNKCKQTFRVGNIWEELKAESRSLSSEAKEFYDNTIDWGARPNERSLSINFVEKQDGSGYELCTMNVEPNFLKAMVISTVIASSLMFRIFSLVFPDVLNQPNLAVKIDNLNKQSKPLMLIVQQQLKKLNKS